MAVKLRLSRVGAKKQPYYRVVAADARAPRDGRFIEVIGRYNPRTEPSTIEIDKEKALSWLSKGAQPTDQVKNLLKITGVIESK
ncbi:MAG: 30S ribosomal protein S16 [Actinobacteria bacterium]|nr:30S ribosomal protein S16 [Actinomycetota bacterium]